MPLPPPPPLRIAPHSFQDPPHCASTAPSRTARAGTQAATARLRRSRVDGRGGPPTHGMVDF
eukprot:10367965-Prorocentrum_lima.AAC.1